MGFLSSLFGSRRSDPVQTTTQVASKLPSEIAPQVEEIVKEAQRLYSDRVAEGYVPYEGATIAPFTQQELDAQAGLQALVGTSAPLQEEALGITRQMGEKFTADTAQEYMNPYQQAVIDIEKRKAQEDFESRILPQFEKQAVRAGGMSGLGSRAGVQAALLGEAQAERLGDIQAKGLQSAYDRARQEFNAQKAREAGQAGQLAKAGPAMFASGLAEQGALAQVGEDRRGLAQEALDEAYFRFLEERGEPQAALAEYSGTVYANPLSGMPQTTRTGVTSGAAQPSTGQQLLGLGLSAANIYGMGGGAAFGGPGFSTKNLFGFKKGGGLSDLVYRQQGGDMGGYTEEQADIRNMLDEAIEQQKVTQPVTDDPRYTVKPIASRLTALGMPTAASLISEAPTGSRTTPESILERERATQQRQEKALQADLDSRKELTEGRIESKERFAREQADKSREALKGYDPSILSNLAAALVNPDYAESGLLGAATAGLGMGIEARQKTIKSNKAELRKIDSNLATALDANEDMLFETAISGLDKKTAQAMEFIRGDAEALERAIELPNKQRKEYLENLQLGLKIEEAYARAKGTNTTKLKRNELRGFLNDAIGRTTLADAGPDGALLFDSSVVGNEGGSKINALVDIALQSYEANGNLGASLEMFNKSLAEYLNQVKTN
tara:strand:+ start:327 stop:2333 length:2007 start_codon:yes stop_codon:yes gene_type:complete